MPDKKHLLVVESEPAPYKADIWNCCNNSEFISPFVLFTKRRNWLPDAGHDYKDLPVQHFADKTSHGKGVFGAIQSSFQVSKQIFFGNPDLVLINGYNSLPMVTAIIFSLLSNKKFLLFVDQFNVGKPAGRFAQIKFLIREVLRKICFKFASGILVCGSRGFDSALSSGCPVEKLYDFPYVVDANRIRKDEPEFIPDVCLSDKTAGSIVLFFSGRMIERKGLPDLLRALVNLPEAYNWVLWAEGDGLCLDEYRNLAIELGINAKVRFLGFCQFALHSWLLRNAQVVIVPSLQDNWGIVVDEALQLNKIVISTPTTGSGYDRIDDEINGYLVQPGDYLKLGLVISRILENLVTGKSVFPDTSNTKKTVTPKDNIDLLEKFLL